MKILFFLFSIIFLANAQVLTCPNGSIQFHPPEDMHNGIYYPTNSSPQVVFPDNFTCDFKINVPQGMFAIVQLIFSIGNPGNGTFPVIVTDQLQRSEEFNSAKNESFYFLENGGNIFLSTGMTNTSFGFSIKWSELPTTFTPKLINVYKSTTQPKAVGFQSGPFLVTAETRVTIVIVPPLRWNDRFWLRSILIYDGPDWNSTCLGTGYQLSKSNTQWVSTGKQMTVIFLKSFYSKAARVIFQDYDNTKQIVQYQGVGCLYNMHTTILGLDSSQGPSALVAYGVDDHWDTITSLDGNGTLDVYIGGITLSKENLIASYQVGNSTMFLPQPFRGKIRTYVLNGANSEVIMRLKCDDFHSYSNDNQPIGRKGFVTSNHYMESYTGQYVKEEIGVSNGTLANFSFVIRCADITENTTFNVMVMNNKTVSYNQQYKAGNLPVLNQPISAVGDSLTVLFDSKKEPSQGLYMHFELLKHSIPLSTTDSSSNNTKSKKNFSVIVSILVTLMSTYFA